MPGILPRPLTSGMKRTGPRTSSTKASSTTKRVPSSFATFEAMTLRFEAISRLRFLTPDSRV